VSFLHLAALAIGLLVVAPLVAHFLARRQADIRDFAPARLVRPSPPLARRKRTIDDRVLFAVRAAIVIALAFLGATPFIRCSRLAVGRNAGASVALAIILDDSLSMLAKTGGVTRWERAQRAAIDLVRDSREGDAIAIVLAGARARIALTSTTDRTAARAMLSSLGPSHRATDLEGAIDLGRALVHGLPQVDRRVVLLSDLSDGHPEGPALDGSDDTALWAPLDEITAPVSNCAVLRADRQRERALVRIACSPPGAMAGRSVEIRSVDAPGKVLATAMLHDTGRTADIDIEVTGAPTDLVATLTGIDAIADDDAAAVLANSGALVISTVADPSNARVDTGGPPAAEQALSALKLDIQIRPLPFLPDRSEDFASLSGVIVEDPAGFAPEPRRALARWLDRGGVALVALGPRAALAPLGATFDPILSGPVTWAPSPASGLDEASSSVFGAAGQGMLDFGPRGRATLDAMSLGESAKVIGRWKDGAPWLLSRQVGRGVVFVLTMPISTDQSDLALRPAFLVLLETFVEAVRARHGAQCTEVGEPWFFDGATSLSVVGPRKDPIAVTDEPGRKTVNPDRIGSYEISLDGEKLHRFVAPADREVDLRPRPVAPAARAAALGGMRANVDLSAYVATVLLALLFTEMSLRAWARRTAAAKNAPQTGTSA
jgi:hypothetical protein